MERRLGGPEDPVDLFLNHIEQFGSAEAMPEVSLPGLELGYVYSQGRSKCKCAVIFSSW